MFVYPQNWKGMVMATFTIKQESNSAKMPQYEDGLFTLYVDLRASLGVKPGEVVDIPSGISVNIPEGHIGLAPLVNGFMGPSTGLILADGLKVLKPGLSKNISIRIANTDTTVRVVRNGEPLCYLVVLSVSEFNVAKESADD
jgi:dUTPase